MTSGKKPRGLRKRAATGAPLTDAELREFGNALRPFARELSALCRQFLADEFEDIGHVFALMVHSPEDMEDFVKISMHVPAFIVAWAAAILVTIPGTRVGRPRKPSTVEALMLLEKVKSSHGAAKRAAVSAGEPPEHIRSRLRGIKQRAKKRRLDTKRRPKGGGKK
jgi:hypothetical protein